RTEFRAASTMTGQVENAEVLRWQWHSALPPGHKGHGIFPGSTRWWPPCARDGRGPPGPPSDSPVLWAANPPGLFHETTAWEMFNDHRHCRKREKIYLGNGDCCRHSPSMQKRQRTGALQDAAATNIAFLESTPGRSFL